MLLVKTEVMSSILRGEDIHGYTSLSPMALMKSTLLSQEESLCDKTQMFSKKRHIYTQGAHLQAWSFFGKVVWCSKGGSDETCSNNVTQLSVLREVEKHMVTIKRDVPERWKSVVLEI